MSAGPLAGRTALVTGGSRGIGAAVARTLGAAGAGVAINYRSRSDAALALGEEIGNGSTAWGADVSDAGQAEGLVARVLEAHGQIDIAVLNAGVWRGGRIDRISLDDWRTVTATALDGTFGVARWVVPVMRAAGFGRIVVLGSVIGLVGYPGDGAYATAKAALLGFVRALSKEVGAAGITVNAVAPGFIETDMTAAVPAGSRDRMVARTSLGRPGTADEVAAAVRFLVCDGTYVTGHVLVVDGGFSL